MPEQVPLLDLPHVTDQGETFHCANCHKEATADFRGQRVCFSCMDARYAFAEGLKIGKEDEAKKDRVSKYLDHICKEGPRV
jgi:hypothetical protein